MFKITIKAKTFLELRTKLLEAAGQPEVSGHAVLRNSWSPEWDKQEEKSVYDTTEEDAILEEAYVHPTEAIESEKPKRAPKKRSAAPVVDTTPVIDDQISDDDVAVLVNDDAGVFVVTPSSTDGISGSDAEVSGEDSESDGFDSKGMPYNSKIHSATRAKNKDGSWRYRRGVEDAKIKEIEATLKPRSVAPAAPSMSGIPPMPTSNVVVHMPFLPPQVQAPIVPTPVAAVPQAPVAPSVHDPIAPPVSSQKPAHTLETFTSNFIITIANLLSAGTINQEYVETLKKHFQVAEIWDIPKDPAKVQAMFENMVQYEMITKVG